jgi:hypothetical protein
MLVLLPVIFHLLKGSVIDSDYYPMPGTSTYYSFLKTDYNFRNATISEYSGPNIPPSLVMTISIMLDPCRDLIRAGGRAHNCCIDTGPADCQDNNDIQGGLYSKDLRISYFMANAISICAGYFADDANCGTYLEVHYKTDVYEGTNVIKNRNTVLWDLELDEGDTLYGYKAAYIDVSSLCAGLYEIWWVIRTRSGPYVIYTKEMNIVSPSCG